MRVTRFTSSLRTAEQDSLFDAIAGGPRAKGPQLFRLTGDDGALEGPFNAFLLQPKVGHALQALGAAVRYGTTLSDRAREIAILIVAVRWQSDFEWYAHEAIGRHVGLADDELAALNAREYESFDDPTELAVAHVTDALAWAGDLDDAHFGRAVAQLGDAQIFELTTLVGYYATLALQLRVFRTALPEGSTSTLQHSTTTSPAATSTTSTTSTTSPATTSQTHAVQTPQREHP